VRGTPRILVTTRHDTRRGKSIQFIGALHLALLLEFGAAPIPVVAVHGMRGHLPAMLNQANGLLFTEGGDIGPALRPYSEDEPEERQDLDPVKDEIEAELMQEALDRDIPILGICRGIELLNMLLGGDLYDDIPSQLGRTVTHISETDYHGHRHPLQIEPGSPLHEIYGRDSLSVTSYHHQGIRSLAPELVSMAVAPDGVIEAFRHPGKSFAWGLQFHPERQLDDDPLHRSIHARFVDAAREHAEQS